MVAKNTNDLSMSKKTPNESQAKTAIIIGAGPAGLTAAYELLLNTDIKPVILEKSIYMGGIARTVNYKGNRIDIGGHRFFSKSDRVMRWWRNMMPIEDTGGVEKITYHGQSTSVSTISDRPVKDKEKVFLVRNRKSRIYFLRKFFSYPIKLNGQTMMNLGPVRLIKIALSYIHARLFPIKTERSLEDFFINRFGRELYLTFFKSYTEKLWGIDCNRIAADWGAQRIKGLSLTAALKDFFKKSWFKTDSGSLNQKNTETSLIEKFLYPKYGPGQMWEITSEKILAMGGRIITECEVVKVHAIDNCITAVDYQGTDGTVTRLKADYFFSTMPIKELVSKMEINIPTSIRNIAEGLIYRDFMTVGLLCRDLIIKDDTPNGKKLVSDNWIYIQEPDVTVGRLQIFNNWSPSLVKDPSTVWIGMEYFVNEGDVLWSKSDQDMISFGIDELSKIDILHQKDVIDGCVIRMPKTYPAYFGTYDQFDQLKDWINQFENLFLIGRNGMHRYNNQDHSMLTAMVAVENIINGIKSKDNIWAVNTEKTYHEEK